MSESYAERFSCEGRITTSLPSGKTVRRGQSTSELDWWKMGVVGIVEGTVFEHGREKVEVSFTKSPLQLGDKLGTMHSVKGVVGLILPDKLMPIARVVSDTTAETYLVSADVMLTMKSVNRGIAGQLVEGRAALQLWLDGAASEVRDPWGDVEGDMDTLNSLDYAMLINLERDVAMRAETVYASPVEGEVCADVAVQGNPVTVRYSFSAGVAPSNQHCLLVASSEMPTDRQAQVASETTVQ